MACGCPNFLSLALSKAGGTKGSTTAEVTRPVVTVDCILETGRDTWAEKCLTACAATEADMVTEILLVEERYVVYSNILLSGG